MNYYKEERKFRRKAFYSTNPIIRKFQEISSDIYMRKTIKTMEANRDNKEYIKRYSAALVVGDTLSDGVFSKDGVYSPDFISDELKDDKEFMLDLIKPYSNRIMSDCPLILEYASDKLRDDDEVARKAVEYRPEAYIYASERIKSDKELVVNLAKRNMIYTDAFYQSIPPHLKEDKEIALTIIQAHPETFRYAPKSLRLDREFILKAVSMYGSLYNHIPKELQEDKDILLAALNNGNKVSLLFLPKYLINDPEVKAKALKVLHPDDIKFYYGY